MNRPHDAREGRGGSRTSAPTTSAAYVLAGGPAEGVVETTAASSDGRVWTINVVHVNCGCEWCAKVESSAVAHVYERRDDDVFRYARSEEATDAPA